MTESTVAPAPAPPATKPASFWEDLIDIFFQPADVFRRRQNASFWPPLITVSVLLAAFTFANANVLAPIIDAEMSRQMAIAAKHNPQITPEMMERGRSIGESVQRFVRYATILTVPVMVFALALLSWLVGKAFGSKQTYHAAVVVVAYASFPRVIEAVVNAVQGLLLDPATLTSMSRIQIAAARFFDADTTNPLLFALLQRLDLFTIWAWTLIAIGVYVTGKISRGRAFAFGVTMWLIGGLWAFRQAYLAM